MDRGDVLMSQTYMHTKLHEHAFAKPHNSRWS